MHVGVLGAGWSGLAAAAALADAGLTVEVFEAARQVGGRARRVPQDGFELDNGQHILLGAYADTLAAMRRVGADPEALLLRLPLALEFSDRFRLAAAPALPAPLNLAAGLVTARGLPAADKLLAAAMLARLKLRGFRVRPDISVAALLSAHRQGSAARRFLWEPLCIAALNTAPEHASAAVFAAVLRDAFDRGRRDSDLLVPRADLSRLFPEPAAAFVLARGGRVHLGAAAGPLARDGDGVGFDAAGNSHRFDAVVCALPPPRAAETLQALARPDLLDCLNGFAFEPIVTCYLHYPHEVRLPRPMLGMDGGIGQWAFDRGALGGPPGQLAVVVSAAARLREYDAPRLAALLHAELAELMPGLPAPVGHRVISERRATFRCTPGLRRPDVAECADAGVYLAGDHMVADYPATLEAAVRSGLAAARAILARAQRG